VDGLQPFHGFQAYRIRAISFLRSSAVSTLAKAFTYCRLVGGFLSFSDQKKTPSSMRPLTLTPCLFAKTLSCAMLSLESASRAWAPGRDKPSVLASSARVLVAMDRLHDGWISNVFLIVSLPPRATARL